MMPLIHAAMLRVSGSLAASIAAKAAIAAALGLVGAWLARGNRAAVRHALLAAAFGVLLLLPVASIVAPPVLIAVPALAGQRIVPAFAGTTGAIPPVAPAPASLGVASVVPGSAGLSPYFLLLAGWIAGTALFLLPVGMGLWLVRWLRRSALPWRHGQSVVESLAHDAGIHRRVEVLLHEALPGPMSCGVLHPAIVLSEDAQTWEAEDLNRAIVHELEHVRRGDWATHCLARAVCAVYWFHPLVWIAWRRLALEAERSCDDAVLGRSEATAYADQLVGIARRLSLAAKTPAVKSPLLAMANRADLATRVGAVLDSRQRRGRAGTFAVALACAAAAVLVLTMSPLRVVAAPPNPPPRTREAPVCGFLPARVW
ncbi:MAG: M56 family metallopeptidase [Bryobacteraceae bacterium]